MKIYVVPTHHWDPYWTFAPEVSEKMGVRNLRKVLDIIRENPDFKYTIGQVYLWELFKKYFPERIAEFKKRVAEGKITMACGGYVNPDFNLPSGESLIRQLAFCKRTWQEEFGVNPEIVWIQDSFGQPASLPQIFSKLGLKFHTAKRGAKKDLPAIFLWEGIDGSRVFFDRQPLGHHGIVFMPSFMFPAFSAVPNRIKPWEKLEKIARFPLFFFPLALLALYLPDFNLWAATKGSFWRFGSALKHLKKLYPAGKIFLPHGFGFDGALPFGYITKLAKIYSFLSKDEMFVASPSEFLKDLEKRKDKLQVIRGELNGPHKKYGEASGALPGTYSARIDVKQRAREMEKLLYLAEFLEILKYLQGGDYQDLTEIWKSKFLTDFHDGICGSLTDENYKILKKKGNSVVKECERIIKNDLRVLPPAKAVLNPLPWERKGVVRMNGKLNLVKAPPMGIHPIETLEPDGKFEVSQKEKTLTTPFYKVDWKNGLKISQNQRLITGDKFARFRLQKENGDAYFWDVFQEKWDKVKSIELIECNEARAVLAIKSRVGKIRIEQRVYFYTHTPRVDFSTEVQNWEKNVRLQVHLPFNLGVKTREIIREIPAGFLKEGESPGQAKWKDIFGEKFAYYDNIKCVQNWIYLPSEASAKEGVAIFNDGLPEHEIIDNTCFLTLLRCVGRVGTEGKGLFKKFQPKNVPWRASSPHPIPLAQEQGTHEFRYAFYPGKREDIVRECYNFLFPLIFCGGKGNANEFSLFSISDKNVIPLAIKKAEKSRGIVIRLLETEGAEKEVEIKFNPAINFRTARLTDLMEEKISDLFIENNTIKLQLKPQEIATLILEKP